MRQSPHVSLYFDIQICTIMPFVSSFVLLIIKKKQRQDYAFIAHKSYEVFTGMLTMEGIRWLSSCQEEGGSV